MDKVSGFEHEWSVLQNSADQYEHRALNIKLMSLLVVGLSMIFPIELLTKILFIFSFWLTEAVYKTFQFRIFKRLETIEIAIVNPSMNIVPFNFNLDFEDDRGGIRSLFFEYVKSAAKPTVAITYLILIGIVFIS